MIVEKNHRNLKQHLIIALCLGFIFRFLSAHFVWGPQALDDYLDNLIPAWRYFSGIEPDLHDYRSPLYMWILFVWIKLGSFLGIQNSIAQVQWVYFFQGTISLFSIYGVYLITQSAQNRLVPIFSMYLVALHGLMPFASTRSFMESFVMGIITLAIAILSQTYSEEFNKNWKKILFGFLLLGFASLVRFQVGVMYLVWMIYLLFKKKYDLFILGFFCGILLIVSEIFIDISYGRQPFETLVSYIKFNSDPTKSPAMPWYNTWLTLLGTMFFPFSFLITRGWKDAIKKYFLIFVPVFGYVLIHSIAPHKEERYLYPIIPLTFIFWAYAWAESFQSKKNKYIYIPIFSLLNCILLFVGCFVNTQVGLIGPLGELQKVSDKILYIDYDDQWTRDNMADFFVRKPATKIKLKSNPNADVVIEKLNTFPELDYVAIISQRNQDEVNSTYEALKLKFSCGKLESATSLSDKILFALNPKKNDRRKPTLYFLCKR